MKNLLVRHAAALGRGTPGVLDAERSLTSTGKARFQIAAKAFMHAEPVVEAALAGNSLDAAVAALAIHPGETTVAVVGHEPMLGALLARMLGSPDAERFTFKKGGVALVALPDGPLATGRLVWFLTPRVLRALGDAEAFAPTLPTGGQTVARRTPS